MGKFDDEMLRLAAHQHLVVSRPQLLEFGKRHLIDDRLARGTIERVFNCVYRIAGSPRTWLQALMAATLAGGRISAASFRAAASVLYLPGGQEMLEISSRRHNRARADGVIVHESRFLADLDIMYVRNIPVTRPARTLNDLGLLVETGELSATTWDHALHDAVRRNLVDPERVWRDWERLGGAVRPGGETVEKLLRRFRAPASTPDSSAELRLLQIIRDYGLPEPVQQHRVWLSETSWFQLDHSWPTLKRYAEFNSYKYHGNRDKFMSYEERRLLLEDAGWDGVVVTDDELDRGAELAMRVLSRKLTEASLNQSETA